MDCDQYSKTVSETFAQRDLLVLIRLHGDYSYHDFLQCFIWVSMELIKASFVVLSIDFRVRRKVFFMDKKKTNFDQDTKSKTEAQRGEKF
jgi:hypothetical protein